MKHTFIILLLATLFISCSTKLEKKVTGTWISSHETKILRLAEDDLVENESVPIDSGFVESPVDTAHYVHVSIIDFNSNGKFSLIEIDTIQGVWRIKKNKIILLMDSIQATAEIINDDMKIEFNMEEIDVFQHYSKAFQPSCSPTKKEDYIDRCLEVNLEGTDKLTYSFIDTTYVIITNIYGTSYGYWYNFYSNGIQCLNTYNFDFGGQTNTFVYNESGESKTTIEVTFEVPKTHESTVSEILPLTPSNYNLLKSNLIGRWENIEDFYPKDSLIEDERRIIDFNYTLTFEDTTFLMLFSGFDTETNESIERKVEGKWQLDKYGKYVTLNHKELYRNREIQHTDFVTFYSIDNERLEITIRFKSLIYEMFYSGLRIKMNKKNGL